jgi:hypothetical protein
LIIDVRRFGVVIKGAQFFMKLFVDGLPSRKAVTKAFGLVLVASSAWGVDGPPGIVLEPESQSVASGATVSF